MPQAGWRLEALARCLEALARRLEGLAGRLEHLTLDLRSALLDLRGALDLLALDLRLLDLLAQDLRLLNLLALNLLVAQNLRLLLDHRAILIDVALVVLQAAIDPVIAILDRHDAVAVVVIVA